MADFSVDCDVKGEARQYKGMSAFVYQRQPRPYPTGRFLQPWQPIGRDISRIPSVIASPITTGPTRTLSPQISVDSDSQHRSTNEIWKPSPRIQIAPSRKARVDALRDLPYMIQQRRLTPKGIRAQQEVQRIRRSLEVNRVVPRPIRQILRGIIGLPGPLVKR